MSLDNKTKQDITKYVNMERLKTQEKSQQQNQWNITGMLICKGLKTNEKS